VAFYKSEIGLDLHTSAIWLFSFILNENLNDKIHSMSEYEGRFYCIFSIFFFYIIFNLIFLRIFLSLIEDVYEKVSMEDTFSWLENKMSFGDYVKSQMKEFKNRSKYI
jgi:hypothetical protein